MIGNENPVPQRVLDEEAVDSQIEKSEDTKDGATDSDTDDKTFLPVDTLLENEVASEDVVTDNISGTSTTYPPQSTPSKFSRTSLMFTTPTKTAKSAERKNCVLDVNKENIDSSANKTEPGKIKIAVIDSAKSLGKLKKEYKMHQVRLLLLQCLNKIYLSFCSVLIKFQNLAPILITFCGVLCVAAVGEEEDAIAVIFGKQSPPWVNFTQGDKYQF